MKPYNYRFESVLTFRELEKEETESAYKSSIEAFEIVATELFDLLKKKETTLSSQQEQMKNGFSVDKIHHFARFINSLETKIAEVQQKVIQARSKMNWFEEKLLERTLEVRKFEKMKEKDQDEHRVEMEHEEAKRLDELSTLTFRGIEIGR